jgi:hypothetical protein
MSTRSLTQEQKNWNETAGFVSMAEQAMLFLSLSPLGRVSDPQRWGVLPVMELSSCPSASSNV